LQRHIRGTLQLYRERQDVLVEALRREGAGLLETAHAGTGMYLVAWLPRGIDDRKAVQAAAAENVDAVALSTFSVRSLRRGGLVLGYSGYDALQIRRAVKHLCAGLAKMAP
jgi:GntR family transcriptional regulator/MocR family aminotransferase